jgi:hypothetical protein
MATVTLSKIEKAVLQALAKRKGGIAARKLATILANEGYQVYDVQRVMRRGLDRGDFELGPDLQLQAHVSAAPVPKRTGRAAARHLKR